MRDKAMECLDLRETLVNVQRANEHRVDYLQFDRIRVELQRALKREKQAEDLLNEQNEQFKSLTDLLEKNQEEKDLLQEKVQEISENEKRAREKIDLLNRSHQEMDNNVKRAENAIRLVVRYVTQSIPYAEVNDRCSSRLVTKNTLVCIALD